MYFNRSYLYSPYWTGTSLEWRLMQGNIIKLKRDKCNLHLKRLPRISLTCKLVPVQYREYEFGLLIYLPHINSCQIWTKFTKLFPFMYLIPLFSFTGDTCMHTLILYLDRYISVHFVSFSLLIGRKGQIMKKRTHQIATETKDKF